MSRRPVRVRLGGAAAGGVGVTGAAARVMVSHPVVFPHVWIIGLTWHRHLEEKVLTARHRQPRVKNRLTGALQSVTMSLL
jgi:hypothetical protein